MTATTTKTAHAARAVAAGSQSTTILKASEALFEAGGKKVLNETLRSGLREGVEEVARAGLAEVAPKAVADLLIEGSKQLTVESGKAGGKAAAGQIATTAARSGATEVARTTGKEVAKEVTRTAGKEAAKAAGKEVAKGIGRAAAVGGVLDGDIGTAEAVHKYRKGELDGGEAALHAVKETATGAAASGAGVAVVAAVVAFTGPVGWAAALAIGGGTSIAAKLGLNSLFG